MGEQTPGHQLPTPRLTMPLDITQFKPGDILVAEIPDRVGFEMAVEIHKGLEKETAGWSICYLVKHHGVKFSILRAPKQITKIEGPA